MPIEIIFSGVRQVEVREVAQEELSAHQIRVRTLYSAITHGTEMSIYQGTNPFFSKHIDDQGLFAPGQAEQFRVPFRYGYEQVGEVTEVGKEVANYRVGEHITASYGHRSEAVITPVAHKNLPLPADAPPERFLFLPLGTVALDSFLTSRVRLGEGAVIFGLGTVGLLLVCLCRLGGVQPIIGVDFLDARLEAAKELGAHHLLNPRNSDVGPTVKELTADRLGTDVVFETSGSYAALHEAIRCGAPGYSRLVATSFYQNGGGALRLGEEFHHGGSIGKGGCTQILRNDHGLPPAFGRPWDRLRIAETFSRFLASGAIEAEQLITAIVPAEEAAEAYRRIDRHPESVLKLVLGF